jgi:hypothetical protein
MPVFPLPNRCIWCLRTNVPFDLSHCLPECVGNSNQHILPPGIVCKKCNSYFGSKVEPKLLSDPPFHIAAVALGLVDPDDMQRFRERLFDSTHPPDGAVNHDIHLKVHIDIPTGRFQTDIDYTVKGRITLVYSVEDRRWLSRAIHKIAFESLAWSLYVKGNDQFVNLFGSQFDGVRRWSRQGQPIGKVRAVLRRFPEDLSPTWSHQIMTFPGDHFIVQLNLFGDWYVVSLTAKHDEALTNLKACVGQLPADAWVIGDTFEKL